MLDADDGGAPWYRIWTRRKTILVQFYREP
jgi:hypothetical protein